MIANQVSIKFAGFLKTVRKQARVTTRELGEAVGKSAMYVSKLENGQIKTIDFETALIMFRFINEKFRFTDEDLTEFLVSTFDIEPEFLLQERIKESEYQVKQQQKELKHKLSILASLMEVQDLPLVNLMLRMAQTRLNSISIDLLDDCLNLVSDAETRKELFLILDTLCPPDYGVKYVSNRTEKEDQFVLEFKKLLAKYGYEK